MKINKPFVYFGTTYFGDMKPVIVPIKNKKETKNKIDSKLVLRTKIFIEGILG